MTTRSVKPAREDTMLSDWESRPEQAPSQIQEEQPTLARFLALIGLILTALGLFAVLAPVFNKAYVIGPVTGVISLSVGAALLLFHALTDRDVQYRLMYLVLGYLGIGFGVALRILPLGGKVGGLFLTAGPPSMVLGLLFVLAAIRHESDTKFRLSLSVPLGAVGFAMVVLGGFAGYLNQQFLLTEGVLICLIGLLFVASFMGVQGYGSDLGYYSGAALGIIGGVALVITLLRTFLGSGAFFVPGGLILCTLASIALIFSLVVCTDWPVLVLFRRELKSFFFSPIGWLTLVGNVAIAWVWFLIFLRGVQANSTPNFGGMPEPIVHVYLFNPVMLVALPFIIPVITMRLFSEESRSGTLEVLMTAPISEFSVVLGKFLASMLAFLLTWTPWFGFLLALRVYSGAPFEFQPLLSFLPVLITTGMAFVAIGLFFSSTTSNQVIAAVLTFVAMILQEFLYVLRFILPNPQDSVWLDVITYISPLDLWSTSLYGILAPRAFLYHLSVTVFFLFLTTKVLEARKWK